MPSIPEAKPACSIVFFSLVYEIVCDLMLLPKSIYAFRSPTEKVDRPQEVRLPRPVRSHQHVQRLKFDVHPFRSEGQEVLKSHALDQPGAFHSSTVPEPWNPEGASIPVLFAAASTVKSLEGSMRDERGAPGLLDDGQRLEAPKPNAWFEVPERRPRRAVPQGMATDPNETPQSAAPEKNAADTGLDFSIGQGTTTGTGPGAGTGSLDGTRPTTDFGPGLDFTDDEDDERRKKTQDHDLGGARADDAKDA
jgi:hypothetical protein